MTPEVMVDNHPAADRVASICCSRSS